MHASSLYGSVAAALMLVLGADATLVNRNVIRRFDLSSPNVRIISAFLIENTGNVPEATYTLLPPSLAYDVAFLSAKDRKSSILLPIENSADLPGTWQVLFPAPLAPGEKITLTVDMTLAHALVPFPAKQAQAAEQQLLFHNAPLAFPSPYETMKQKILVTLPTPAVTSYTKGPAPVALSHRTITYGPYEGTFPADEESQELRVHFAQPAPPVTLETYRREVEVSHWGGNFAVEEHGDLRHDGAALDGHFSRIDFQLKAQALPASALLSTLPIPIPLSAQDIYFRDRIGNVSTSVLHQIGEQKMLELRPRFPIYGGWRYSWYHGYNRPLSDVLRRTGPDAYALRVAFLESRIGWIVDDMTLRIVLPEGASNIRYSIPFAGAEVEEGFHSTYLDSTGRPTLWIRATHVVEEHAQVIEVTYDLPEILLLQKPIVVGTALFSLFLSSILLSRVSLSISGK